MKKKVTILALHLGYGGIERTICSQANMLCNEIETEIVSLYKTVDKIPYDLDSRVKVKYLTNLKPNREEFKRCLKRFNIFGIIGEGFKAVKILYLKKHLIKKYIKKCDSKIIISTRIEFNELLNKYHNSDCITICEEHAYHHNDEKYIERVKNSLTNIDYFMPSSLYLSKDYEKILKGMNVKVKYIPLTIDSIHDKNKLDNKNIIAVGRLSKEKGYDDLIRVMEKVRLRDENIKLTICGDGPEREALEKQIGGNHSIRHHIKITGFLNNDELDEYYKKSSLFVMTSHEESFGLVLLEAMSYGIPCFAFDSALGACEIINNKNGKLIKNRDIDEMAKSIYEYFDSDKKYNTFDTVNKYYIKNVEKEWKKFVNEIIM